MSEHFFSGVNFTLSLWQHAFFGSLQVAASADATLRSRTCSGVNPLALGSRICFGMEHSLFGTQLWTKKTLERGIFLVLVGVLYGKIARTIWKKPVEFTAGYKKTFFWLPSI